MKLNEIIIDYDLIKKFDVSLLHEHGCIPVQQDEFYTYFYIHKTLDTHKLFNVISKNTLCDYTQIAFFLNDLQWRMQLYELYKKAIDTNNDNQNSINHFLDLLLMFALEKRSSDIHFESAHEQFIIRFRIDGMLKVFFVFDHTLYPMLSSVIKLRCKLDMTQLRKPLNGRFSLLIHKKRVDFRVSTMPTILGESIVLRVLEDEFEYQNLPMLGLSDNQYDKVLEGIQQTQGLILVTGPTGSGKTTTLYSILHQLNMEEKKIITIEDPIEYQLEGIQQIAVNEAFGLSFSAILKDILRQDPDVIMVGEIRDTASLQIALQAALTGHLVLTTLHTNDAISSLFRLFDLQAKPYMVANTLKMIISQRLVLKCCSCIQGCSLCNYSGFNGRIAICEVLGVDDTIALMIAKQKRKEKIARHLKKMGFVSLQQDAKNKIKQALTTHEEVVKVLGSMDEVL